MNSHLRPYNQIFIVQTEPNDFVTAKQLDFKASAMEDEAKLPTIKFEHAKHGFAKDCWIIKKKDNEEEPQCIITVCKSSVDDYINVDCLVTIEKPRTVGQAWVTQLNRTKIKA